MEEDHYTVLGVKQTATTNEIRRAFHRLALNYHPDKNPDGEVLFKSIARAHEILSDECMRREYDQSRKPASGRARTRSTQPRPARPAYSFDTAAFTQSQTPRPPGGTQSWDEDEQEERERRAREDAEKFRRREPLSAYQFSGREKKLFDEVLKTDENISRVKQSVSLDGDFHKWRRRMEEKNAAAAREAEEAAERARAEAQAAELKRMNEAAERDQRQSRLREETRREWENELRRMEEERRVERRFSTREAAAAQRAADSEGELSGIAAAAALRAVEEATAEVRRQRSRQRLDETFRLPRKDDISKLTDGDIHQLEARLTECLKEVRAEQRSRRIVT